MCWTLLQRVRKFFQQSSSLSKTHQCFYYYRITDSADNITWTLRNSTPVFLFSSIEAARKEAIHHYNNTAPPFNHADTCHHNIEIIRITMNGKICEIMDEDEIPYD